MPACLSLTIHSSIHLSMALSLLLISISIRTSTMLELSYNSSVVSFNSWQICLITHSVRIYLSNSWWLLTAESFCPSYCNDGILNYAFLSDLVCRICVIHLCRNCCRWYVYDSFCLQTSLCNCDSVILWAYFFYFNLPFVLPSWDWIGNRVPIFCVWICWSSKF